MARKTIAELQAVITELRQQIAQQRLYNDALWRRHLRDLHDMSPSHAIIRDVWQKLVAEFGGVRKGHWDSIKKRLTPASGEVSLILDLDVDCDLSAITAEAILKVVDAIVVCKVDDVVWGRKRLGFNRIRKQSSEV